MSTQFYTVVAFAPNPQSHLNIQYRGRGKVHAMKTLDQANRRRTLIANKYNQTASQRNQPEVRFEVLRTRINDDTTIDTDWMP